MSPTDKSPAGTSPSGTDRILCALSPLRCHQELYSVVFKYLKNQQSLV